MVLKEYRFLWFVKVALSEVVLIVAAGNRSNPDHEEFGQYT